MCNCQKNLSENKTAPTDQCLLCFEKHFAKAYTLAHESGYSQINHRDTVGNLAAAEDHVSTQYVALHSICRSLRHAVQTFQTADAEKLWTKLTEALYEVIKKENAEKIKQELAAKHGTSVLRKVYIFSNVEYPESKKLEVTDSDLLVFLNTAKSIGYYADHKQKLCFHRSPEPHYGTKQACPNFYVCNKKGSKEPAIPQPFLDELSKAYDWNYDAGKDAEPGMTTGYIVANWLEKIHSDKKIILVNFGYEVKKSTYRCPWHNWQFEAEQLKRFEHIYTAETITKG